MMRMSSFPPTLDQHAVEVIDVELPGGRVDRHDDVVGARAADRDDVPNVRRGRSDEAVREDDRHRRPAGVHLAVDELVRARAARERVDAVAAVERVVARVADERVVAVIRR